MGPKENGDTDDTSNNDFSFGVPKEKKETRTEKQPKQKRLSFTFYAKDT